mgnify:CR=1 FL=1
MPQLNTANARSDGTLVFCDDTMLAHTENVWRSLHHPIKHEANPILEADRPWEGYVVLQPGTVVYDEHDGLFKMWYNTQVSRDNPDAGYNLCYATSSDGVHWDKPELGLVKFGQSTANNILLQDLAWTHCVLKDEAEADLDKRYKLLFWTLAGDGIHAAFSKDGVHWSLCEDNPVVPKRATGDTFSVMQAVLDTTFWLATHVVCVTLGYGATFLAEVFAGTDRYAHLGLANETIYYYRISAVDNVGNESDKTDYVSALPQSNKIRVPQDQLNIQAGIDAAVDGDSVWVSDGTYTGLGNVNLDFKGKAITVRSVNGAGATIIDCRDEYTRGLYFQNGETSLSVLDGFTITRGNATGVWPSNMGGGISFNNSSPTITNCIIVNNQVARYGGGVFCCLLYTSPSPRDRG